MTFKRLDKGAIGAAIITASGAIVAAIIVGWLHYIDVKHKELSNKTLLFTGMVINSSSNKSIGQANITVVGRSPQYFTEDDGNFQLEFQSNRGDRIRIHVHKVGYKEYDRSFDLPALNVIIALRPLK